MPLYGRGTNIRETMLLALHGDQLRTREEESTESGPHTAQAHEADAEAEAEM